LPSEDNETRIYIIVKRTINAVERRYVEWFGTALWSDFKHCCRGFTFATPSTTVDGLDHLEGEDVIVLGDGQEYEATVSGGAVTIVDAVSTAIVGLPYDVLIETLPLQWDRRNKLVGGIFTDVIDSFDWESGLEEGRLELNRTREYTEVATPTLYTGKARVQADQQVDRDATVFLKQTSAYPFEVTGSYFDVAQK